jgi:hypothetical protein
MSIGFDEGAGEMITVTISINGQPIYTRTAVNVTKGKQKLNIYKVDDGSIIKHNPEHGAVVLSKMMLDTIKEVEK